jgi:hypothetical protein
MDEVQVLETTSDDELGVDPTCTMSIAIDTMNKVIRNLSFFVHV